MTVNAANVDRLRRAMENRQARGAFLPAVYVVEPTSRCNVKCIMCPNSRLPIESLGNVDLSVWSSVLAKIAPYAELVMLYFMGEPTLHPEFPELLRIARQRISGKLVLSTNALAVTQEQRVAMLECLDLVIVCIDRWSRAEYERIRVGSQFDRVVETAEALLRDRGGRSVPTIVVKALDIRFPGEQDDAVADEVRRFAEYWRSRGAIALHGWLDTWAGQLPKLRTLARLSTPYTGTTRSACADLWFKMIVNWQGNTVLCCHNWDYTITFDSLRDRQLTEIWQGDALVRVRERHLEGDWKATSLCERCPEWGEADELDAYLTLDGDSLFRVF